MQGIKALTLEQDEEHTNPYNARRCTAYMPQHHNKIHSIYAITPQQNTRHTCNYITTGCTEYMPQLIA
jgi:hypothetical protein